MEESILGLNGLNLSKVRRGWAGGGGGGALGTILKVHRRVVKEENDLSENYMFSIHP